MNVRLLATSGLLLALLGGTTFGLLRTREAKEEALATPGSPTPGTAPGKGRAPKRERLVDQRPLQTARRLSALAITPEEKALARQAERLANHDVDLAFTEAIRQAAESAPSPTPELQALRDQVDAAEASVAQGERSLKRLQAQLAAAPESARDRLEDQMEVAKAQLALSRDELEEARDDLERAGGDPQARIRRLKEAHEAADQESRAAAAQRPAAETLPTGSLIARFRAWWAQRAKARQLTLARSEALAKVQRLTQRQETLAQRLKEDADTRNAAKQQAQALAESGKATRSDAQEAIYTLEWFSKEQRKLTVLATRAKDERELAETYIQWLGLVEGYQRTALHLLLRAVLAILCVITAVIALTWAAEHLLSGRANATLRSGTHRPVVKIALRTLGTVVVLFIVVGLPSQATAVFGLLGAALTVALKDFIVAFFGWFILMGRNGIRVGDWVEIRGVGGEVVEIGLLRTVVLETGSWDDSGHPTGRRVSFVNRFAVDGHFFNFSTSGQWMWDELKVMLPAGQDPYPLLEGVQRLVEEKTRANADLAEQEWRKATKRYRVQAFTATPGLQVVPTSLGIEIRARYITRAFERHETRRDLYQAVVDLMHPKPAAPAAT